MCRLYGILSVSICALLLFGFAGHAVADNSCLTEFLSDKEDVYFYPPDIALDYPLKNVQLIKPISDEYINDQGNALKKSYSITLPSEIIKLNSGEEEIIHRLTEPIEVQTQNGQRYLITANTEKERDIRYKLPKDIRGYKITIPRGTELKITKSTNPPEYVFSNDKPAILSPAIDSRLTFVIDAQRAVERVPGTFSTGTTLQIEPKRAPVGEYISVKIEKSRFQFGEAQFCVCLRKQVKSGKNQNPYVVSNDVEKKKAELGKAELRVQIPNIGESGPHFAIPVELVVVAQTTDGELAEAVSQEFAVSSRMLAGFSWFLAIIVPWIVAGLIAGRKSPKKALRMNPIWFVSGMEGNASISLAQILLWTVLVFSASFYVLVVSGKLLDLTDQVLMLLGIAGASSVISKIASSDKDGKAPAIAKAPPKNPKWLDLFQTAGRPDLYKVQLGLFTTLAAFFVGLRIFATLEFPELPAGLLALIGISNGVYLGAKVGPKSAYEKITGASNELSTAEKELEGRIKEVQNAVEKEEEAKKKLEGLEKEATVAADREKDTKKELERLENEANDAAEKEKDAEKNQKNATESLESKEKELSEEHDATKQMDIKKEIEDLRKTFDEAKTIHEAAKKDLEAKNAAAAAAKTEHEAAANDLEKKKKAAVEAEKEHKAAEERKKEAVREKEAADKRVEAFKKKVDDLKEEAAKQS